MNLLSRLLNRKTPVSDAPKDDVTRPDIVRPNNYKAGKVVSTKRGLEYEPHITTKGGRVVRAIPKGLKKIRDAQK